MKHGHIADARRKAKEASTLDVAYSVMDDRPEIVLADIDRAEAEAPIAKTDAPPSALELPAATTVAEAPQSSDAPQAQAPPAA